MELSTPQPVAGSKDDEEFGEDEIFNTLNSHDSDERVTSETESEEHDVEVEVELEDRGEAMRRLDKLASSMPHFGTSLPRPIEQGIRGHGKGNSPTDSGHDHFDAAGLGLGGVSAAIKNVPASMPTHEPGFMPPHIYASTYSHHSGGGLMDAYAHQGRGAAGSGFGIGAGSMIDGRGHTLKGRAALKARNAFMRQTGFLEPDTPSEMDQQPPDRIATPAIVVDANGAE